MSIRNSDPTRINNFLSEPMTLRINLRILMFMFINIYKFIIESVIIVSYQSNY